jgi:hypothetical protein
MNESNEENLGLDWLDKMLERFKSEPVFETPQWNAVLAELGRITVYFEIWLRLRRARKNVVSVLRRVQTKRLRPRG